ncbi:MAG: nucleotidyltransferase family protein [Gemmatimonadaceae bacterium]
MSDADFPGDTMLLAQLPAESALIALTNSGAAGQQALRAVVERPIRWERLMHLAARERAVAGLNEQLARTPIRGPLPAELSNLQRLALVSEFQLSSLHDRLVMLLALYAAHDIDVLLLKGAGLAHSAYARPTDRPMGDIDLLVRPEVALRARDLALENGWARRRDVPEERSYAEHQHLSPLEDADGLQIGLELHTALFTHQAPFKLPPEQLWEGSRRLTISGHPAYVPSPEDQLLHAALHFAWSHEMTFGAFRTLRDLERILASSSFDWPTLVRKARAARGATCCYWTLRLARDLAGVQLPPDVLAQLSPRLPERVLRALTRYFAEHALPNPDLLVSSVSLSRALWTLGVRPRAQGHGPSRPWLDTEEWVRVPGGMRNTRTSAARRFLQHSFGLLRSVGSMISP